MENDFKDPKGLSIQYSDLNRDSPLNHDIVVAQEKKKSKSTLDLPTKIAGFIFAGLICLLVFGIPIAEISVGSIFIHECPIEPRIPIYVIVRGASSLLVLILLCVLVIKEKSWVLAGVILLLTLFCIGWFITGTIWIFRVKGRYQYSYPDRRSTYCHYTMFQMAYILNFFFVFFIIGMVSRAIKDTA